MTRRQLDVDGSITLEHAGCVRCLEWPGDRDPDSIEKAELAGVERIDVVFGATTDGRGFSLPARLSALNYRGRLFATGALLPDQLSLAFQCGFDGVLVDQDRWAAHGEHAWRTALSPAVSVSYTRGDWGRLGAIWERRRAAAPNPSGTLRRV